jgi:hypothetical protein
VNLIGSVYNLNKQGKTTLLFIAFLLVTLKFIYPSFNVLSWDVFGYYLYLPAKFIYHDPYLLNQDWLKHVVDEYQSTATLYQINQHPESGNWIIKYSMGMSFLYAPFFFIAHWLAPILGYKQDGFSAIYGITIESGMFIFSLYGLYFLLKILSSFFDSKITIISLILIVFATNYLQLNIQYSLLTHVPLFTLYCILIYNTIQWNKIQSWSNFYMIALTCGLIILIRPNEIVCLFIPLLWNNHNFKNFKEKIIWLIKSKLLLILAILVLVLPFFIQMWYWKNGTNQWLFYSYNNPGEGFDFLTPYTFQFLLSFRKGWLIYTPLAIIALLSIIVVYKKNKAIVWAILFPILISIYIDSSWSCWWYAGGSYSQRAILSVYPLLAISLGYGINYLFHKCRIIALLSLAFILVLNIFQAWQFNYDILDHERMTFSYYKKIFFKTKAPQDANKYLLVNRSADENENLPNLENYEAKVLVNNTFSSIPNGKENIWCDTLGKNDNSCIVMNESNEFFDGINQNYSQITNKDHFWIIAAVDIFIPTNYTHPSPSFVAHFNHGQNGTYKYRIKSIENNMLKVNEWNHLDFIYLSPEVRSQNDEFKLYLWHPNKTKIFIDNLKISVLTPK